MCTNHKSTQSNCSGVSAPSLKFGPRNLDGSHEDGFNQVLLSKETIFKLYKGKETEKVCGVISLASGPRE